MSISAQLKFMILFRRQGFRMTVGHLESGQFTKGITMVHTTSEVSCASLLKVLADETRLAVVRQLMGGPKHVGEINEPLGLEQSLMSHHLRILRESGLVTSERDGKAVLYSLSRDFQGSTKGEAIDLGCCLISFD